jgi:hypothetical protein
VRSHTRTTSPSHRQHARHALQLRDHLHVACNALRNEILGFVHLEKYARARECVCSRVSTHNTHRMHYVSTFHTNARPTGFLW